MRFTKAIVSDIVQAARCADCAENVSGAMTLNDSDIVCASCDATRTFVF